MLDAPTMDNSIGATPLDNTSQKKELRVGSLLDGNEESPNSPVGKVRLVFEVVRKSSFGAELLPAKHNTA
jgi:hypothetical protein